MARSRSKDVSRREFLQQAGLVTGALAAASLPACQMQSVTAKSSGSTRPMVALIHDPADPVSAAPSAQWAIEHLRQTLASRGLSASVHTSLDQAAGVPIRILTAGPTNGRAHGLLAAASLPIPDGVESIAVLPARGGNPMVASGSDSLGLVYALTDLADRIALADDPRQALQSLEPISERPANRIRSIFRMFVSEIEDKRWFYDRDFWQRYLTMLVSQRFNRFNLSLGLGYDFSRDVSDSYFFFAYPFLLNVPGYNVRAVTPAGTPLADAERERNLQMLRFISDEAAARGLHFQLGIWTHSYQWTASARGVNYNIDGLDEEKQAPYSRDALHMLLEACPNIKGISMRTHGESGVPEGRYDIWKVIMSGVTGLKNKDGTNRVVELDLHGKGITQEMIDTALGTGMPVTVSPKFWAEHMGLPYLQSSIRQLEMPRAQNGQGLMALSSGTRNFLRYSFGDLIQKNRKFSILHRVWPGTQHLLLWGDPAYAADYGRVFHSWGTDGVDYFEPLSFKGRAGSGIEAPDRTGYADASLRPSGGDWEKYLYTYRLLGRLAYNPDAKPEVWQRQLRHEFKAAAPHVEAALAASSRVLPLITSASDASASNFNYSPEMYLNSSIFSQTNVPSDSPAPRSFITISSLDPQIFASIAEHADALLAGTYFARINPLEVAMQLEKWADTVTQQLGAARKAVSDVNDPAFRRVALDAALAAGIGRFFALKTRAATYYAIFDRTGNESARKEALAAYTKARDVWTDFSKLADGPYAPRLTFGNAAWLDGNWTSRLPGIDSDIAGMQTRAARPQGQFAEPAVTAAIVAVSKPPARPAIKPAHTPPASFRPGQPLALGLSASTMSPGAAVRLWYRHVNQGEVYSSVDMQLQGTDFIASIPGDYTNSTFPLQYYFEILPTSGQASLYPGFRDNFLGQPYFAIQSA